MLQGVSRKRLGLSGLIFVSIVGFGILLVSRFNATNITPANNSVQSSPETSQTASLQATDKVELGETDLIEVKPSEEITTAEQAMPQEGTNGYRTACLNMKQMYTSEREAKLQAESSRSAAAKQEIINKYNRDGKSFSTSEKISRLKEATRHEGILKQLDKQYQQQLKKLGC